MKSSEKFINQIKEQNIKPIPKWRFTSKNSFVWITILIGVIFGAFAFSIILFSIQQLDFSLISHMKHSKFELLLGLTPFFWLISLIVFLLIAISGIKNSKKGYKFTSANLILVSITFSMLLGTLFFIGGGARWLENAFAVNVSAYESIQAKKIKMWTMPHEGYLSGTIENVEETSLILNDFNDENWTVDIENANFPDVVLIEKGEKIKLTGKQISTYKFKAEEIRPWGNVGNFRNQKNLNPEK